MSCQVPDVAANTGDSPVPDVSIIIVNWNTREMTLECLRSLYAETVDTVFEVILVDNGSHDGSAEAIAAEFPQVRLMAEQRNHGFAIANNLAAKVARAPRLLLLNSDTLVLDRAIDRLMAFARTRPEAGVWGGRTVFGNGTLNRGSCWGDQSLWSVFCFAFGLTILFPNSTRFNSEAIAGYRRDRVREVDIVCGCFLLMDTTLWQRLDGFDEMFFMYGEEADLCARARRLGARPVVTPEATIVHYGGASGLRTDAAVRLLRGKIALGHRYLARPSAALIRWLYLVSVMMRASLYGLSGMVKQSAAKKAAMWREVFRRRREWFSSASRLC